MGRYISLLLAIILGFWGCNEQGNTKEEVGLWGEVYLVEDTDTLNLFGKNLTGPIPPELGDLTNLTHLYLHSNSLSGSIPPEIGKLTKLTHLYLHSNFLSGSIPSEIGNLKNLTNLSLSFNNLTGTIPSGMKHLTNLYYLNLAFNSFIGEIPDYFCNSSYPYIIYNEFCPPYPDCIDDYVGVQDTTNCD